MIQQLMFGDFRFDAVTGTGQFVYNPHDGQGGPGPQQTINYSSADMTTWFNDRNVSTSSPPQAQIGTLTVNFNFTVPSGYNLYLAAKMGIEVQMASSTVRVYLNGSLIKSGWTANHENMLVASAGTSITSMAFTANVGSSGFNDGYVVRVDNFILVPTGTAVDATYDGSDILANVSGAVATGA